MPDSLQLLKQPCNRPLRTYEGIWRKLRADGKVVLEVVDKRFIPRFKRMISKEKDMDIGFKMISEDSFTIRYCSGPGKEFTILLLSDLDIAGINSFVILIKREMIRRHYMVSPVVDSLVTIPLSNADAVKNRIAQLQTALQQQLPEYESLLHIIHRNLEADPNTVHLLTDEEIGVICAGLSKKTGIMIAKEQATKLVRSKGKISVDDL